MADREPVIGEGVDDKETRPYTPLKEVNKGIDQVFYIVDSIVSDFKRIEALLSSSIDEKTIEEEVMKILK